MLHRRVSARLLLILLAVAAGCNSSDRRIAEGEEPIAALQVRHPSQRYDTAYWIAQARASTAVWAIGLQFCQSAGRDLAAHPNCASVMEADARTRAQGGGRSRRGAPVWQAA